MQILSFEFLVFLGIIFLICCICKGGIRKFALLVANIFFLLSFGHLFHVVWLFVVAVYSYLISKWMEKQRTFLSLIIGVAPVVLSLLFFKYIPMFGFKNIVMPLGISFYTFKIIGHLVDVYKNKTMTGSIIEYLVFVSFFPVFTAGPIMRSHSFYEQMNRKYVLDYQEAKNGAVLCALGMFEKLVISDYLSIICTQILSNKELTGGYILLGVILYSFQIYTDFDAYSNIAIGISRILGFQIDRNFHTPYLAVSIMDFWDRWHISLSSWLKDYVYIPLGGNRKGTLRKYLNTLCVFVVSGLWHGSTLNFLIWGIGHGLVNMIENMVKSACKKLKWFKFVSFFGRIFGVLLNFALVSFLWIFFRSATLGEAIDLIQRMFVFTGVDFNHEIIGITVREGYWLIVLIIVIIATDLMRYRTDMVLWLSKRNFLLRWCFYALLITVAIIFGVYGPGYNAADFIYATF